MNGRLGQGLSRRERQIMEAVYRLKTATARAVRGAIPEPPSYSAVRATLQVLVGKGLLSHCRAGRRYVYAPTVSRRTAQRSAVQQLLSTYFDGSGQAAMAALLRADRKRMTEADYRKLMRLIRKAEKEGGP